MGLAVRSGVDVEGFRSFDHEYGEFEDEFRVVGLFRIFSVELEGLFVGKQSCLFTGSKMGVVQKRRGLNGYRRHPALSL